MPSEVFSLMEERAKRHSAYCLQSNFIALPQGEEAEEEIARLTIQLKAINKETASLRKELKLKEKLFLLLANYKYVLEKEITPIIKVKTKSEEKKELMEELKNFTPKKWEILRGL